MQKPKRLFRPRHSVRRAVSVWIVASVLGWVGIGGLLTAVSAGPAPTEVAEAERVLDAAFVRAWGATTAGDQYVRALSPRASRAAVR